MNSLIPIQNRFALQISDKIKSHLDHEVTKAMSRPCLTVVSKTQGGVGADILVSILVWAFERSGIRPAVFQAGGTKGLLCETHDPNLFVRARLEDPALDEKLASFIGNNLQKSAVAMLDPSVNGKAHDIIWSIVEAQAAIDIRIIHLVRAPGDKANFAVAANEIGIPTTIAMLEPVFIDDDDDFSNVLLIPRLPDKMVRAMMGNQLSFRQVLEQADFGSASILASKLKKFFEALGAFYG